jgi:5-(carboxyamino)imidazole ribonucleotide synthase
VIIPPGSTIGILGGGQLGRMLAIAAIQLGYRVHIYAPEESGPAADIAGRWVRGAWDDAAAMARFFDAVDIITYEFENIPVEPLASLDGRLRPNARALAVAQDRLAEKEFVVAQGGRTAPFRAVESRAALDDALAAIGYPAILKTRRFGYDGKGQVRITRADEAEAAWSSIAGSPAVLEGHVTFGHEFSILLCRGVDGATRSWDAPDNVHVSGILATSTVPAPDVIIAQAEEARALACAVAEALDYVGVLACEFFAAAEGPVFNEMAPRVHNSGHWTIEGSRTSQFENHIRAICGLPLGATDLAASGVVMTNLIGEAVHSWPEILADDHAHLHLYGKETPRAGRKMGHVTRLRF